MKLYPDTSPRLRSERGLVLKHYMHRHKRRRRAEDKSGMSGIPPRPVISDQHFILRASWLVPSYSNISPNYINLFCKFKIKLVKIERRCALAGIKHYTLHFPFRHQNIGSLNRPDIIRSKARKFIFIGINCTIIPQF